MVVLRLIRPWRNVYRAIAPAESATGQGDETLRITAPDPDARVDTRHVDLFDAQLYAAGDPHLVWQTLRAEQPVFWTDRPTGPGFWSVTRRSDVRDVLRDHGTYTSEGGTVLWMLGIPDPAAGQMMAVTDPPRHREIREPLGQPLAAKAMARYADWMNDLVDETTASAWDCDVWDLAQAFARLPVASIVQLMDLPRADVEYLMRWTYASIAPLDPHYRVGPMRATLLRSHHEIVEYFRAVVRDRRRNPGADLLSHLLTMEVAGRRMTESEIIVNCYSILLGGAVTTSQAITATVIALAERGGGEGRFPPGTATAPAVEEALRWASPTMHFMRYARRDVDLHGVRIGAGDAVVAWIASANRDAATFRDPYRLDLGRSPNPHLAFGSGVHRCVGHPLARLTLSTVFERFLSRLESFELAAPPVHLVSNAAAGVVNAPIRLRRPKQRAARPRHRPWLLRAPDGQPARLFCLPYSGCGASIFRRWPRTVGAADVLPVQLPGRENRFAEPHFGTIEELADAAVAALRPFLDRPYALFGHCAGALQAYEIALRLAEAGCPQPDRVFLSGQPAPHLPASDQGFTGMTEPELRAELTRLIGAMDGKPTPEMLDLYLAVYRPDLAAVRRYRKPAAVPLAVPVTVVGWRDSEMPPDRLRTWSGYGPVEHVDLPGGHYAFLEAPEPLLDRFREWSRPYASSK